MNSEIFSKAYQIKDKINSLDIVKELNKIEKEMENNVDVIRLAYKKDMMIAKYTDIPDILKKEKESALKDISLAKEELQKHPIVEKYLKLYSQVRDLYAEINNIMLSDLGLNCCKVHKNENNCR